jgi:hypothetical protein
MATFIMRPNAAGDEGSYFTLIGAATPWECVDEVTSDGDTTRVNFYSGTTYSILVGLEPFYPEVGVKQITDVTVHIISKRWSNNTAYRYVRVKNGTIYNATAVMYYANQSYVDDSVSLGVLSADALSHLQIGMQCNYGSTTGSWTHAYVVVTYIPSPAPIVGMAFDQSLMEGSPVWTDVSSQVLGYDTSRGRQHILDKVETGTARVILNNASGDFWRSNASGTFYVAAGKEVVKPLTQIRIRHSYDDTVYDLFYGYIENIRPGWLSDKGGRGPCVQVDCVDAFKMFSRLRLYGLPGQVGVRLNVAAMKTNSAAAQPLVVLKSLVDSATEGTDLERLHVGQSVTVGDDDASEVNVISAIDVDTYTVTMTYALAATYTTAKHGYIKKWPAAASYTRMNDIRLEMGWPSNMTNFSLDAQVTVAELEPLSGGSPALDHILAVADAEGGMTYIAKNGWWWFDSRDHRLGISSSATFSADLADQKYSGVTLEDDDSMVFNEVNIAGDNFGEQIYRDTTAQALQGPRVLSKPNSIIAAADDAFDQALVLTNRLKDSVQRASELLVLPDSDVANLYPKALGYDISTKINLELNTSPNLAGIDRDYYIEGVKRHWRPDKPYETRWQLWGVDRFLVFQSKAYDGVLQNIGNPYATVHDAASGLLADASSATMMIGQGHAAATNTYYMYRSYLQFDCAKIPDAATVLSAYILLYVTGQHAITRAFDVTVVPGTNVGYAINLADYGDMRSNTTVLGSTTVPVSNVGPKLLKITLNAAGIAAISKLGGIDTQFGLRSDKDISSSDPASGGVDQYEYVTVSASEGVFAPRLVVELNEVW